MENRNREVGGLALIYFSLRQNNTFSFLMKTLIKKFSAVLSVAVLL